LASSPTRHSYLNSRLLKSEPIVNLSTAQLIGYEVLTQLPSKHVPEQKKQYNANFEKRLTERPAQEGKMPAAAE
ncbi:hypothetical protein MJO10_29085, partial [Salmonella enterica subsp. enterica serovar Anatum]|nr:hypothetical protein [Salmonella enterica subsp. enterica serovar Anatum]